MGSVADQLYRVSPVLLQHALVSTYGVRWNRLRFGGNFRSIAASYLQREHFTQEEWAAYTQEKLREILVLAYERVPFYRKHWKGVVTLDQLCRFTVQDMPSLPPLEKSIARDHPQSLLVDGKPQRQHIVFHTSGSSGIPVATYWLPEEYRHTLAIREMRACRFARVSYSQPRATFSGRIVEPDPESKGPYYRYNLVERQVYFSAFHLRPETVAQYVGALRRHRTVWLTGYSNSIYQLAQLARDRGLDVPQLKAIITTSEKLTPEMRVTIESVFGTKVYEEYATVEDLFYVCENEFGQKLINPDHGLLEVVDGQFKPVVSGQIGEVLATGFIRRSQPMIRYRLGDSAILSGEKPLCGREMPVLQEVVGRIEDTVYGPDGRRMVRFHGIFVNQPHIQEGQIIQERLDLIRVRVVPKLGFDDHDVMDIIERVQQRLTPNVRVMVEPVEKIERTEAGKFRAVICNLSETERQALGDPS